MIKSMVLAIDPGGTTGLAARGLSDLEPTTMTTATPEELWDYVMRFEWTTVVCERFSAQVISKYGLYTVRLIGGVEALCRVKQIPFVLRTTQNRKAYMDEAHAHLMKVGRKFVDHQTDALAHLLAWEHREE